MERRRSDPTRLEALSDGVFAFAATLLVVSLEVPKTFDELLQDLSGFGAFALSFGALSGRRDHIALNRPVDRPVNVTNRAVNAEEARWRFRRGTQ